MHPSSSPLIFLLTSLSTVSAWGLNGYTGNGGTGSETFARTGKGVLTCLSIPSSGSIAFNAMAGDSGSTTSKPAVYVFADNACKTGQESITALTQGVSVITGVKPYLSLIVIAN